MAKKPMTNYMLRRTFKLEHGADLAHVADAVTNEGFFFEGIHEQDLVNNTFTVGMKFPVEGEDPVVVTVTYSKVEEEPAYELVRKLIEEEILPG